MNKFYLWLFVFLCCLTCDVQNLKASDDGKERLLPLHHSVTIYGGKDSPSRPPHDILVKIDRGLLVEIDCGPAETEMNKIIHYLAYQEKPASRKGLAKHYKKEKGISAESLEEFLLKQALEASLPASALSKYLAGLLDTTVSLQKLVKELIEEREKLEASHSAKTAETLIQLEDVEGLKESNKRKNYIIGGLGVSVLALSFVSWFVSR